MAGTSYTRQSTLTDGDTITASLFNAEYNQLVTAFSYAASGTTGHQHDGGAGEGGNIEIIGDQDFNNKIVVDSSNNRWSVYVEVGGSAVEQVRIEDGVVYPVTDSDVDLGTNALRFKDAYIDSLTATTSLTLGTSITVSSILDEDDMSSDSATALATQQSIKAYVDAQVTAQDLDLTDGTTSISIDLDSEALSVLGGTGVTSTASGNGVTLAIDSTVTTLTGSQTLTNKTLTSPDINTPDIDGGTIDGAVIGGSSAAAGSFTTVGATGNITVGGTVDGRDVATDGTKLDGIEASATADQTNAEIRTAVEAASDSNVFTDADHTKLNAIEASADVTDTANVTAAGALMDSELTAIASVKALNQGVATTDSPTFAAVTVNGNVEFDGLSGTGSVTVTDILDQDDMSGNSATALATQQSIKAYVDAQQDTVDTLAEILALSNATGGTDIAVGTGDDITFADNSKAIFGSGSDLQIYHSGTASIVGDFGTGDLLIRGENLKLQNTAGENYLVATNNDAIRLYYDNAEKLATASGGISVTGEVAATSLDISGNIDVDGTTNLDVVDIDGAVDMASTLTVAGEITANGGIALGDNDKATFGASDDLQIYHDGLNSYIKDIGTGSLKIAGADVEITTVGGNKYFSGSVNVATLFHTNNPKLATTSGGIQVTGDISNASGDLTLDVAGNINLDADGGEFRFKDGGTLYATAYQGGGGSFYLASAVQDKDLIFQGNDGGSTITALTLDMSAAGKATFNSSIDTGGTITVNSGNINLPTDGGTVFFGADVDMRMFHDGSNGKITNSTGGFYIGSDVIGLQNAAHNTTYLGFASGGAATFNAGITVGGNVTIPDYVIHDGNTATKFGFGSANTMNFISNGSDRLTIANSYAVFNEAGTDYDFRVESSGNANMLFVDGGNNRVGVGTGSPAVALDIAGSGTTQLRIQMSGQADTRVLSDTGTGIVGTYSNHPLNFKTNSTTAFTIASDGSLSTPTAGTSNVRFGVNAGNSIQSGGNYNTVVGDEAGTAITTGDENTFIGYTSGDAVTTATGNTAVGFSTLTTNVLGSRSVAVGRAALQVQNPASATNMYNTAVGFAAGESVTTGTENTLIGALAGDALTDSDRNVALGYSALGAEILGQYSTAIGWNALGVQSNSSAANALNTAVGYNAGGAVTTGVNNTLIGGLAGDAITTGLENTAVGRGALGASTTGQENVAVGSLAAPALTTARNSTFIGYLSGRHATTTNYTTAIGSLALNGASGSTTADNNTAVGYKALYTATTGANNTALGFEAGKSISTGIQNVFVGSNAGDATDGGTNNVGVGHGALSANCGGSNTGIGHQALSVCTANNNTAVGQNAQVLVTSGAQNTSLGAYALQTTTTGTYNIGIGYNSNSSSSTASGQCTLGDGNISNLRCNDQSISSLSDSRDKTDVIDSPYGLDFINTVRPVQFKWESRDGNVKDGSTRIGFIAQELLAATDGNNAILDLVLDDNPDKLEAKYGNLLPIAIQAIQELSAQVDALTARIETLEG